MALRAPWEKAVYDSLANQDLGTFVEVAANKTYTLELSAPIGKKIVSVTIKTASGTCTAALQRNTTNITGLTAIAVTSVVQTVVPTADGTETISVGQATNLVITANAAALDLSVTVAYAIIG